jgi:hypothetical protein
MSMKSSDTIGNFFLSYLVLHCSGIGLSIVVCIVSYRMLWFFQQKKSDGFGRERTRDLGYQRPACKPLDHRSRWNRSRDLPFCSAVPQPLRHRAVHKVCSWKYSLMSFLLYFLSGPSTVLHISKPMNDMALTILSNMFYVRPENDHVAGRNM